MGGIRRFVLIIIALLTMSVVPVSAQRSYTGRASYYNESFEGRTTANGQTFSNDSMFCAHRTLPFGTILEVTNLKNNRTVFVKVVDRGPYISGRIIDLSREAARRLDFLSRGVARVRITVTDRMILPFLLMPEDLQDTFMEEKAVNLDVWNPYWHDMKAIQGDPIK